MQLTDFNIFLLVLSAFLFLFLIFSRKSAKSEINRIKRQLDFTLEKKKALGEESPQANNHSTEVKDTVSSMVAEIDHLRKEKEDEIISRMEAEKQIELAIQKTEDVHKRIEDWKLIQEANLKDATDTIIKTHNDLYKKLMQSHKEENEENREMHYEQMNNIYEYLERISEEIKKLNPDADFDDNLMPDNYLDEKEDEEDENLDKNNDLEDDQDEDSNEETEEKEDQNLINKKSTEEIVKKEEKIEEITNKIPPVAPPTKPSENKPIDNIGENKNEARDEAKSKEVIDKVQRSKLSVRLEEVLKKAGYIEKVDFFMSHHFSQDKKLGASAIILIDDENCIAIDSKSAGVYARYYSALKEGKKDAFDNFKSEITRYLNYLKNPKYSQSLTDTFPDKLRKGSNVNMVFLVPTDKEIQEFEKLGDEFFDILEENSINLQTIDELSELLG